MVSRETALAALLGAALFGCPTDPPLPSDASSGTDASSGDSGTSPTTDTTSASASASTTATSTSSPSSSDATTDPTGDATSSTGSSSSGGPACVDGQLGDPCDPFGDTCPACAKCMPWADDGGNAWNADACSPVVADPDDVGDPCMAIDSALSGLDTCDHGAMCWDVDAGSLQGTCVELCSGSVDEPTCTDPTTTCMTLNGGVLNICVPSCDPLLQDCPNDYGCYPAGAVFGCIPAGAGVLGDGCAGDAACAPGLLCAEIGLVPGCPGRRCCTEFCDTTAPACTGAGQECTAYYPTGAEPPGLEAVGICALP